MNSPAGPDRTALDLMQRAIDGGLRPLQLGGRSLLPVVQGGMGVGVSAHRLAGSVAALGAMGTISSVDLRRHHPDLMERTHELLPGEAATQAAKEAINAANLEALEREIRAARVAVRRARPAGRQRDARGGRVRAFGQAGARMRHRRGGRRRRPAAGPARPGAGPSRPRCWCRSCPTRAACSCWCASGSARSACPMPSSSSIRAWPAATSARPRSPTWATRASISRTSSRSRWPSCAAPASSSRFR